MTRVISFTLLTVALLLGSSAKSQELNNHNLNKVGRYMPCDNSKGAGFFWVDTTTGKVWWAVFVGKKDKPNLIWKYLGQEKDAKPGKIGTYIPFQGGGSGGLFILNTVTGEGWWTRNGKDWIKAGKPSDNIKTEPKDPPNPRTSDR